MLCDKIDYQWNGLFADSMVNSIVEKDKTKLESQNLERRWLKNGFKFFKRWSLGLWNEVILLMFI